MSDKIRKLKDAAARYKADGDYKDALETLLKVVELAPHDLPSRRRCGDLYFRLGKGEAAIGQYQAVAGAYATKGLLLKAIAVFKLILQVDPNHQQTQKTLAELYSKKRGKPVPATLSGAMAAVIDGGGKRSAASIRGRPASQIGLPRESKIAAEAEAEAEAGYVDEFDIISEVNAPVPPLPAEPVLVAAVADRVDRVEARPAALSEPEISITIGDTDQGELQAVAEVAGQEDDSQELGLDFELDITVEELTETEAKTVDPAELPPIPLFSELPKKAFIRLLEDLEVRHFAAGDFIITRGETGQTLYVIVSGRASVEKERPDRSRVRLAVLREGAFFGEMALLGYGQRLADVVAQTPIQVLEISSRVLKKVSKLYPSVRQVLNKFYKHNLLNNLFKTSSLFLPFDRATQKNLVRKFKTVSVKRGTPILTQGKKGNGLFLLLSGCCEVSRRDNGRKVVLADLREGDLFGEMSLLTNCPAVATVTATRKSLVMRLPRKNFREMIMTHPQILELVSALSEERANMDTELLGVPVKSDVKLLL